MALGLPPIIAVLTADTAMFSAKMAEARAEMAKTTGSGSSAFAGLSTVGKTALVAVGAAALGVAVASVKMAMDFDAAMLRVQTQAGASASEVAHMHDAVLALAPTVGQGPQALAEALFHVESAGYRSTAALDILKASGQAASISGANLTDVTNTLIATMQSGVKGFNDAAGAMGVLNAIVGAGNMTFQELTGAMGTGIEAAAATFGVSLQSVGAALAMMTDMGVPADAAATHLRMSMALLGAPTKIAAKYLTDIGLSSGDAGVRISAMQVVLEKAGVTTTQLSNDMRQPDGLLVALQDLKTHMTAAGLTANEQGALIARAFGGGKSGTAIMEMYGRLDLLKVKFDAIKAGASSFGDAWTATTQDFGFQVHQVWASVQVLGIEIGEKLIPKLQDIARFFAQNRWAVELLAAAIGGVLVTAIVAAGVAFIAAAAPIIAIELAIAALSVAIYLLVTHLGLVKNWLGDNWKEVVLWALMSPFLGFKAALEKWGPQVVTLLVGILNNLKVKLGDFVGATGQVMADLSMRLLRWAGDAMLSMLRGFVDNWPSILAFFVALPFRIIAAIIGLAARLVAWADNAFAQLLIAFVQALPSIIMWFAKTPPTIMLALMSFAGLLVRWAFDAFDALLHALIAAVPPIIMWFANLPLSIVNALGNMGGFLFDLGRKLIQGLIDGIRSMAWAVGDAIRDVINSIPGAGWVLNKIGIPGFAAGGIATGLALVGEKGPELTYFSGPTRIVPADQTAAILSGARNITIAPSYTIHQHGTSEQMLAQTRAMLQQHDAELMRAIQAT